MTKEELKLKLDASDEKVNKRVESIKKVCTKLGLDSETILKKSETFEHPFTYLRARQFFEIPEEDPEVYRDEDGKWTEKADEVYERNSRITDLYDSIFKLRELVQVRDNWKAKYDSKVAEDNVEKVTVIWDFLTEWENKCIEWYMHNAEKYYKLSQSFILDSEQRKIEYDETHVKPDKDDYSSLRKYDSLKRSYLNRYEEDYFKEINALTKDITRFTYSYKDGQKVEVTAYTVDEIKLRKVISQEKERKYKDLVTRVENEVGTITSAENLHIGRKNGEINGYVQGTKGKCSIETISAGGYNIQCFHYRVLVHKI